MSMKEMMEQMIAGMNKEERREMISGMMDAFFRNMTREEKSAMMSEMMPRMMGSMMESMFPATDGAAESPTLDGMQERMRACCEKMGFSAGSPADLERNKPRPEKQPREPRSKARQGRSTDKARKNRAA